MKTLSSFTTMHLYVPHYAFGKKMPQAFWRCLFLAGAVQRNFDIWTKLKITALICAPTQVYIWSPDLHFLDIPFTIEREGNTCLPCVDTEVMRRISDRWSTSVYKKSATIERILAFTWGIVKTEALKHRAPMDLYIIFRTNRCPRCHARPPNWPSA